MLMQNFGGQIRCIMGNVEVVYMGRNQLFGGEWEGGVGVFLLKQIKLFLYCPYSFVSFSCLL